MSRWILASFLVLAASSGGCRSCSWFNRGDSCAPPQAPCAPQAPAPIYGGGYGGGYADPAMGMAAPGPEAYYPVQP
jgi:hypothetical protein